MCEYCAETTEEKLKIKNTLKFQATQHETLTKFYRSLVDGSIKPHTQEFKDKVPKGTIRAVIHDLLDLL